MKSPQLVIFLSAGHGTTDRGGFDPGADSGLTMKELGLSDSDDHRFQEVDFTTWFVELVMDAIGNGDVRVPDGVVIEQVPDALVGGLHRRAEWVERAVRQGGISRWVAVQVHANASARAEARGVEAIIGPRGDRWTRNVALAAVEAVAHICKLPSRGVKIDEQVGRKLFWVRRLPYGVIWEVGFLSNKDDVLALAEILKNRQLRISLLIDFLRRVQDLLRVG
jgi:hypothetical protein